MPPSSGSWRSCSEQRDPRSRGIQISPDGRRTLVSKDVGEERWAIVLNHDDGTVTGNVFPQNGGEPFFVWCDPLVPDADPLQLVCQGTPSCLAAPCVAEAWQDLGFVILPRSFFLPRASAPVATRGVERRSGGVVDRASGVQITPDARRVLISKDVEGQRWSIALNLDDRTVTGNVYLPGGDPSFLWCEQKAISGDEVTLSCSSAAECEGATCPPKAWSFAPEVTLPASFFRPPTSGDPRNGCLASLRAGDLVSASVQCGAALQANRNDGQLALIRAVADPIVRASESAALLGQLAAFGVSIRGSAFDVCKLGFAMGDVARDPGGEARVPRGAEIQRVVSEEFVRIAAVASARIAEVPNSTGIGFPLRDLPRCLTSFDDDTVVDVDRTDLRAVSSVVELLAGVAHLGAAYDLDFDVGAAIDRNATFTDVFLSNANLLVLRTRAEPELDEARAALERALSAFSDAIDLARAESDDQSDDLLVVSDADAEDVELAREVAEKLRTALSREARFEADTFGLSKDQRLRLGPLFDGQLTSLRGLLPIRDSSVDACRFLDPTFGGVARDMTQAEIIQLFSLRCDAAGN